MNADDFRALFHVGDHVTLIRNVGGGAKSSPLTVESVSDRRISFRVPGSGSIRHVFESPDHPQIEHDPVIYERTEGGVTVRSGEFAWTYLILDAANNAQLIRSNIHGLELRHAADRTQTWPGYHATAPLDRPGYWMGTHREHRYIGQSKREALAEWDATTIV